MHRMHRTAHPDAWEPSARVPVLLTCLKQAKAWAQSNQINDAVSCQHFATLIMCVFVFASSLRFHLPHSKLKHITTTRDCSSTQYLGELSHNLAQTSFLFLVLSLCKRIHVIERTNQVKIEAHKDVCASNWYSGQ